MESLPLAPFESMTPVDYEAIGLMCGLEVHQQLLTRTKLFCRCPAGRYTSEYDAEIIRHMRPTLSEMGEYDGTALMEKKTRKNIWYRIHHDTVCTYEFDDTPPFLINDEAIDISLELSMLLKLNLVDELHIARKQYLDGSIPTGFQRITILGIDGELPYGDRRIGIRQISLEEDSCREVSDRGHDRVYRTDRLGMPLVEVVTEPDMRTPEECADVCRIIGNLCRCTQKVRRGYGATRQDVNVSVRGGTRIEIKGVPQIWRIPRLVYNEASRQVALLRIRDTLNSRGITEKNLESDQQDVAQLVMKTSYAPIRTAIDEGRGVRCVLLRGFAGLLNEATQEHTKFSKEFSDRIRVIACLPELPNMIHSDSASESLLARDWQKLRRRMKADERDALLVVWGDHLDLDTACEEIVIRAREAAVGVPSDTRQPLKDGTNGFERVLPGADRMYPDTDLPPIEITRDRLERIRSELPPPVWEAESRFLETGMIEDDAARLSISPRGPVAWRAIDELGMDGKFLGVLLSQRMRALSRQGFEPRRLTDGALLDMFRSMKGGRITADAAVLLLERLLQTVPGGSITGTHMATAIEGIPEGLTTPPSVVPHIGAALAQVDPTLFPTKTKLHRFLMGWLMRMLLGGISGRKLSEALAMELNAPSTLSNGRDADA